MNADSKRVVHFAVLCSTALGGTAQADFIKDAEADLTATNYYFSTDYRDEVSGAANQQSKREEWAQGFALRLDSGFTEGAVGFGLDTTAMLGLKLDSGPERSNTGLLQQNNEAEAGGPSYAKRAQDSYQKMALTAKMRFSKTDLRLGTLVPELPVLQANGSRLFPSSYQGGQIVSREIKDLTLTAGQINRAMERNSMDYEPLTIDSRNSRFTVTGDSDRFSYGGAQYKVNPNLNLTYFYGELTDFYTQHYFNVKHSVALGAGKFGSDIRYFISRDAGARYAGKVDNHALSARLNYAISGHNFALGYQKMSGDTGFAMIDTTNSTLFTEIQVSNFSEAEERSLIARYDYDFSALGIPGFTFMTRYVSGEGAATRVASGGSKEWERNTDLGYAFQKGSPLENLAIRLRNATYRSQFARDVDQTRFIVSYTLPLM